MASPASVTACSEHRRRSAVAVCSVCGRPLCESCIVSTPVGLKCRGCTGVAAAPTSRRSRRRWAAVLAATALVVVGLAAYGLLNGEGGGGRGDGDVPLREAAAERPVRFTGAGGIDIAASLTMPPAAASQPVPAVLVLSGFGPSDRNGRLRNGSPDPLYQDLARALADAGVASLRYDKRGTGESALPADRPLRFDDLVGDAKAALSFLSERKEVAGKDLAVVGHEEGGLLGMRLAASEPRLKGLVLISTPGRPVVEVFSDDFAKSHGEPSGAALQAVVNGLMATGSLPDRDALPPDVRDFFPEAQVPYLKDIFSFDPVAEARAVDVPVLIVRGDRSTGISAADSDQLAAAMGPDAEVVVAPNAGHTLALEGEQPRSGPDSDASESHDGHEPTGAAHVRREQNVLRGIANWVAARLAATAPR